MQASTTFTHYFSDSKLRLSRCDVATGEVPRNDQVGLQPAWRQLSSDVSHFGRGGVTAGRDRSPHAVRNLVGGSFEGVVDRECRGVSERQVLHQDYARDAAALIDPEIGIVDAAP